MAAWSGWAGDLLHYLGFRNTSGNLKFLTEWHSYEQTPCHNNPVSASRNIGGSTLCKGGPKRNYLTRANGLTATAAQLHEAKYAPIYDALQSGHPYRVADNQAVVAALTSWGSIGFADAYALQGAPKPPTTVGTAPQALRGYNSITHSLYHNLPSVLSQSNRSVLRAYRALGRRRKVKG